MGVVRNVVILGEAVLRPYPKSPYFTIPDSMTAFTGCCIMVIISASIFGGGYDTPLMREEIGFG
jgi:hypothetical protein